MRKVFMRQLGLCRFISRLLPIQTAADALRKALSLWRGKAFGLVIPGSLCRIAAQRYETARVVALEKLLTWNCGADGIRTSSRCCRSLVEASVAERAFLRATDDHVYRSGRRRAP